MSVALPVLLRRIAEPEKIVIGIYNEKVGDEGAIQIADAIASSSLPVISVYLKSTRITARGVVALAASLCLRTQLTNLTLTENWIGDAGAIAVASIMAHNPRLEYVAVRRCDIGDAGAVALAAAVERRSSMTRVCGGKTGPCCREMRLEPPSSGLAGRGNREANAAVQISAQGWG